MAFPQIEGRMLATLDVVRTVGILVGDTGLEPVTSCMSSIATFSIVA